jgi:phosphoenolpyruvate phosphomutase
MSRPASWCPWPAPRTIFRDDLLITYGDLLFRSYILRDLLDTQGEIVVTVDSQLNGAGISGSSDYAYCSRPDDRALFRDDVRLVRMTSQPDSARGEPSGRWIGMMLARGAGVQSLREALTDLRQRPDFNRLGLPDLLNDLIENHKPVHVHYINGHWLDVNTLDDLDRAGYFTQGGRGP